jgi:RecB family exonuclease
VEVLAVEEPFVLQLSDQLPDIQGRIDLAELSTDGSLVVTDFKTAQAKTEPEPEQLVLYRQAARMMALCDDQAVRTRYVCLLKTKEPEVVTFEPEIPDGALEALTQRYTEVWEAIQSGCSFPVTGWWCAGCQWKRYCEKR